MKLSLLQIARLRGWEKTTLNLIEQAIADTPGCTLDFDTERDIDLPWFQEFQGLRPALDLVLLDQFGVDLREVGNGPPRTPLTAVQRASAPHLLEYLETLSALMEAVVDSLERELNQDLAAHETKRFLQRVQSRGLSPG